MKTIQYRVVFIEVSNESIQLIQPSSQAAKQPSSQAAKQPSSQAAKQPR